MKDIEKLTISTIRILAAETVQKAKSGHPGLPIGAAPMAFALWRQMKHNPGNPAWQARDRFVLSAGHASALLYSLLHLFGYGLTLDDLKAFRQMDSKTPGHPEYGHTAGVECTTGPLGQGFASAVGMAMAEAHLAAKFNQEGYPVVDNFTYVLMGDGCMMEGAASEAASMAGNLKLGKLIALYDSNHITIEGDTKIAFTEDVAARFAAYGWQVLCVDNGEDIDAIDQAIAWAKAELSKPSLIIVKTEIAYGTPKQGQASAHGEPLGEENIAAMKENYGWPYAEAFTVPDEVYAYCKELARVGEDAEAHYAAMFRAYQNAHPALYAEWQQWHEKALPEELLELAAGYTPEKPMATRATSGEVLNLFSAALPNLFGGSADLGPSNKTVLKDKGWFSPADYAGQNIHFGVRELAMACACNGIALYGGLRPYCATFMVFADYVKPALRLSALMKLPVLYVLTHDSIGVGEDGPTHQPIEQLASLRATPNTCVFRPADAKETACCYIAALQHDGPSVLALTRQNLPQYEGTGAAALRGGYVLRDAEGTPDLILMASGSEVEIAMQAAELLEAEGKKARVVSMPCMDLFAAQDAEYQESVLPMAVRKRVAIEAGTSFGWGQFVGLDGAIVSRDAFGASAPAGELFKAFGFTKEHVAEVAKSLL